MVHTQQHLIKPILLTHLSGILLILKDNLKKEERGNLIMMIHTETKLTVKHL